MNFAGRFAPLFNIKGGKGPQYARFYLQGLLSKEPDKNMERITEVITTEVETPVLWQNLQQFISDSAWNERAVWDEVANCANARLGGHRDSTLVIDESGFAKQGKASACVARQHNGRLGKTDNCQVGVFSALCRGDAVTMVGARLFMPDEWVQDKPRCLKAGIPEEEIIARTKIDLARELIEQALEQKLDIQGVSFDSLYGRNQNLISDIAAKGLRVVADVPVDQAVWASPPEAEQRPKHLGNSGAVRVDTLKFPKLKPVKLRDAENGPVVVHCAALRVWIWPSKAHQPQQWWAVKMVQTDGTTKYTLINAAAETPLERLAHWQGQRFFVELAFKNAKSHVGAADYQLRKWKGWHHHMALVGLAMLFLLEEKQDHALSCPMLSSADITEMLDYYFCQPTTAEVVIDRILARHQRRRTVTVSKRKVASQKPKQVVERPPAPPKALQGRPKKLVTK